MKILELKNVTKYLNGNKILSEVSFEVEKGDIYGFLGPNGAGKTTTMKCILGLIEPEEGEIKIFGENGLSIKSKEKIGFMPENTYLYRHLTGAEFLRFNGKFFDIESKELEKKIEHLLKKVGLEKAGNKRLSDYSKGMLQRIGLAQSIINDPKLLFLDEPMSGLDPIGRKMVKDLLLELKDDGTTIFFNTHILADAESMCNKISIIHKGKIIVESKKVKDIEEDLEKFFIHNIEKSE
ncbi:MAG: ABC transporter ATP-binding protein [Candidatus Gracilibacteria bacterium]